MIRKKILFLYLVLFVVLSLSLIVASYFFPKDILLILGIGALLIFGLMAWGVIYYFSRPISLILSAIKKYHEGNDEILPEIHLPKGFGPGDELYVLAATLNSLSKRIEHQVSSLRAEKNNKVAILESLGEGVVACDQAMTVTYINRMAEVFLDVKKQEIVGHSFALAKQPLVHRLMHESAERNEPALAVLKIEKKPKRYLDAIAVPRGKEGSILVLQDKTGLHKVIELGRDFIANASHELKTPITIIRGFAETLHDHPELSHEVYKEITQKIVSNCQRMETLVRNLLTLAAIDEGLPRSRLQECDLFDLVDRAKQTILVIHPTAEISIETVGEVPLVLADGDLFLQAILNLLDNAAKYSKPPAKIQVLLEKKGNEIEIRIKDQGMGIPQEDLDRIFERFYAVDKSHSRSLGGSGLGLSIVERIVEKHQGSITVDSELGKGSLFTLRLPIHEEEVY